MATLTEEIEGTEIAVTDTLAYKTYGKAYVFMICRGAGQMDRWIKGESINLNRIQQGGSVIRFTLSVAFKFQILRGQTMMMKNQGWAACVESDRSCDE